MVLKRCVWLVEPGDDVVVIVRLLGFGLRSGNGLFLLFVIAEDDIKLPALARSLPDFAVFEFEQVQIIRRIALAALPAVSPFAALKQLYRVHVELLGDGCPAKFFSGVGLAGGCFR